ncbi:MAG: type II toxin-antitoxin system VapB family antitoxin [Hyphomicrobium sp.]
MPPLMNKHDQDASEIRETSMITLSQDTEQLARTLARQAGKAPEEIIRQALEERARTAGIPLPTKPRRKPSFERMMEISDRFAAYPVLDDRSPEDIIGYDEYGVPR